MDRLGCLLTVLVLLVLVAGPAWLSKAVSPMAGMGASLVALVVWYFLSPRPRHISAHFLVTCIGVGMILGTLVGACRSWQVAPLDASRQTTPAPRSGIPMRTRGR